MTTEAVLLLVISVMILAGVFFDPANGPIQVFKDAGPHLGAKIERSLSSGNDFKANGDRPAWIAP